MATQESPLLDDSHIQSTIILPMSYLPRTWINTLPDELISDILVTTRYSISESIATSSGLERKAELTQTAQLVCRRWMHIVRDTQALWTFLDIERERRRNYQAYVERSGVLPLEINIDTAPPEYSDVQGYQQMAESAYRKRVHQTDMMLHDHAHRIRKLSVSGLAAGRQWTSALPVKFANLRELMVFIDGPTMRGGGMRHQDLYAPQLQSLSLYSNSLNWLRILIAHNLEEFHPTEARSQSPSLSPKLETILWSYRKLRKLVLCNQLLMGYNDKQPLESLEPVTMERLEILSLEGFPILEMDRILGLLEAPRLGTLQLTEGKRYLGRDPEAMPFLYFPLLDTLTLVMKPELALEIAKQVPSVRHLTLQPPNHLHMAIDEALESLFSHWQTLPSPLPLETLVTKGARPSTLLSFLEASQEKVVPSLHKVSIHYADAYPLESEPASPGNAEVLGRLSAMADVEICGSGQVVEEE